MRSRPILSTADTVLCSLCQGRPMEPRCWRCWGSGRIMRDAPDAPGYSRPDEIELAERRRLAELAAKEDPR